MKLAFSTGILTIYILDNGDYQVNKGSMIMLVGRKENVRKYLERRKKRGQEI